MEIPDPIARMLKRSGTDSGGPSPDIDGGRDGELMEIEVGQFPIAGNKAVSEAIGRVRLFGKLARLSARANTRLTKAVSSVLECVAELSRESSLQLRISEHDRQQFVETTLRVAADSLHPLESDRYAEAIKFAESEVDRFDAEKAEDGSVALRFALARPQDALPPLRQRDTEGWLQLLETPTTEKALGRTQQQLANAKANAAGLRRELERLRTESDLFRLLSRVASDTTNSVVITDCDGIVEWVNGSFVAMSGCPFEEAAGRPFSELLFGQETDASQIRKLEEEIRAGIAVARERLQRRRDGTSYWCTSSFSPVRENGDGPVSRWVAIGTDTSVAHEAQVALECSKKAAEEANRVKSEFLANMSHEIRTPMNAIIGMSELALTTCLTAEQREYLTTIRESGEHLLDLLNDLLDLSKIEAGHLQLEKTDLNLADLLRNSMRPLAIQAETRGLELIWHLPMDVPQFLLGDPTRLRRILVNLVGNALKFTECGEIVADVEKQWQNKEEVSLHFSVRDTGIGIPPERLDDIFEAFSQADMSTTRKYGGTGLGLAVSSELVRLMQGRIWVESQVGVGSTFHFTVRLRLAADLESTPVRLARSELAGKTVLVVDDNAVNRRILTELLTHCGMLVTVSEGGEAALAALCSASERGRPFELVLLDAMMPEMDGFHLAEKIQELSTARPDKTAPISLATIMMLSSAGREKDAAHCRDLGISHYLVKPISPQSLLDAILAALGAALPTTDPKRLGESLRIPDRPARTLRVLVADDHEPNRRLASRILQQRGHDAVEVASGREVLERVQGEPFDLVLMDVQMPEMDGFQATAAIREAERETQTHLPVIAVTAYAMTGDREKCMAAGMDAYLSKPLKARELITLAEAITATAPMPSREPPLEATGFQGKETHVCEPEKETGDVDSQASHVEIDFSTALARLDGNVEFLKEQMDFFLHGAPELCEQLQAAIDRQDAQGMQVASHRLKSFVSSYDHVPAAQLATRMEEMGYLGQFEDAPDALRQLTQHVDELCRAMRAYRPD